MKNFISKVFSLFVTSVESRRVSMYFFWILSGVYIYIRNFLESIFESLHFLGFSPITLYGIEENFLHFPLFYFMIFIISIVFLKIILNKEGEKVTRLVLFYSFIIILPPVVDIFFKRTGYRLLYPTTLELVPRITEYLLGLTKEPPPGLTPGIQVEYIVATVCVIFYGIISTRNILKGFAALVGPFIGVSVAGGAQVVVVYISKLVGLSANYNVVYYSASLITSPSRKFAFVLFWVFLVPLGFWATLTYPGKIRKMLRNADKMSLFVYPLSLLFGFLLGFFLFKNLFTSVFRNIFDFFLLLSLPLYGALFAVFEGALSENLFKGEIIGIGILVLAGAWIHGYPFLYIFLFLIAVCFLRYKPPLKLNRFRPLRILLSSLELLIIWIAGFSFFGQERSFSLFPWTVALGIFLASGGIFLIYDKKR